MNSFLRIITVLICLFPMQSYGAQRPIIMHSEAIPACKEAQTFMQQVLKDYAIDPSRCQILAYNDPTDLNASAHADPSAYKIYFNEARKHYNSFDPNNPTDFDNIYTCYHEAGHLKDQPAQKSLQAYTNARIQAFLSTAGILATCGYMGKKLLEITYPNSSFLKSKLLLGGALALGTVASLAVASVAAIIAKYKSYDSIELRADSLACEQLLKKEWGPHVICVHLMRLFVVSRNKPEITSGFHDSIKEFENIKQTLKNNGYEVILLDKNNDISIQITQNDVIKSSATLTIEPNQSDKQ